MFVLKALELSGLKEGDVEFVNVPAQNVTRALERGILNLVIVINLIRQKL